MKAKPYQVTALIPQIQNGFKGALVFGSDFGIVQELSEKILSFIVSNVKDDFSVIKITPSKIKEINTILLDEGNSTALFGGRKVIWIKEADNTVLEAVENYIQYIQTNSFLLISAGNLTKSSGLRNFCEAHKNILCVACYEDTQKDISDFIQKTLSDSRISIGNGVMPILVERLSENRLTTKKELEKLITYLGEKKTVQLDDVLSVITDTQNSSVDEFCHAVATGDFKKAEKEYHLMLANGENPVGIIRILYNYFNKLLDSSDVFQSSGMDMAIKKIMKPAQFRLEASFKKQIMIWKKSFILKVLNLLLDTEKKAKSTGYPIEVILGRVLIQITNIAQKYK